MSELRSLRHAGPLLVVLLVLATIHAVIPPLTFTGDEPRYAGQGIGLYTTARLRPERAAWNAFLSKSGLSQALYPFQTLRDVPPAMGPASFLVECCASATSAPRDG